MCDPILVTLLKMRLHDNHSSLKHATTYSGTSSFAFYQEVPPHEIDALKKMLSRVRETVTHAPDARRHLIYGLIFDPCPQKISL